MRCFKVEFKGYKKLADTYAHVDSPLVAFVGANEAGKTSILRALEWTDQVADDQLIALSDSAVSRTSRPADDVPVVMSWFHLSPEDRVLISHLDVNEDLSKVTFGFGKLMTGEIVKLLEPPLTRNRKPISDAVAALDSLGQKLIDAIALTEDEDAPSAWLAGARETFMSSEDWTDEQFREVRALADWFAESGTDGKARSITRAKALRAAIEAAAASPHEQAIRILYPRSPRFVLFDDEDRGLTSEHPISDPNWRASPPRALASLLSLAGTTIEDIWGLFSDGNQRESLIRDVNYRLADAFDASWNQSGIHPRVRAVEPDVLKLELEEVDRTTNRVSRVTTVEDRSDGLLAFVALVAFVLGRRNEVPPILLIDEAERHLHLDAQADLVRVLQGSLPVTQVLYSTHSPGCLPEDLGASVRFVEPTPDRAESKISHDFWRSKQPGFAAILFSMGASASAFSAVRRAVFAEGPSEMILLPTLLRLATGKTTLDYQIAPRVRDFDESLMPSGQVAAQTAYLLDGDGGGDRLRGALVDDDGIGPDKIIQHPRHMALEDFVDRKTYLQAINDLRTDQDPARVTDEALRQDTTVAHAVACWFRDRGMKGMQPGKTAVATYLVNLPHQNVPLKLSPRSKSILQDIDAKLSSALES